MSVTVLFAPARLRSRWGIPLWLKHSLCLTFFFCVDRRDEEGPSVVVLDSDSPSSSPARGRRRRRRSRSRSHRRSRSDSRSRSYSKRKRYYHWFPLDSILVCYLGCGIHNYPFASKCDEMPHCVYQSQNPEKHEKIRAYFENLLKVKKKIILELEK